MFHSYSLIFQAPSSLGPLFSPLQHVSSTYWMSVVFGIGIRREKSGLREKLGYVRGCMGEKWAHRMEKDLKD